MTATTTSTDKMSSSAVATPSSAASDAYFLQDIALPAQPAAAAKKLTSESEWVVAAPAAAPSPLVMAYYPDWAPMDPKLIDYTLFDWIDFAFAVPTPDS